MLSYASFSYFGNKLLFADFNSFIVMGILFMLWVSLYTVNYYHQRHHKKPVSKIEKKMIATYHNTRQKAA